MRKRDVHTKECLQRVTRALNRRWRRERDRRAGIPTGSVIGPPEFLLIGNQDRERERGACLVQNLVEPENP